MNPRFDLSDAQRQSMDSSEQCWIVYSLDDCFLYENSAHRRLVGLSRTYDTVGRHLSELPAPCYQECAVDFTAHLKAVRHRGQVQTLDVHPDTRGDWYCYFCEHTLLTDRQNQGIAVLSHGQPLLKQWQDNMKGLLTLQRHFTGSDQVSMTVGNASHFTPLQAEVLFYLLCRVETKRIAAYMATSESCVNKLIDRMRIKLGVGTTSQLVEKAVYMNWHQLIPKRLLHQVSVIIE